MLKHRRSPSITQADAAPPTPMEGPDTAADATDFASNPSVRQSPPPINGHTMPTGMVISPPDSSENSDVDDATGDQRGRETATSWDQLKQAVRGIDLKRQSSPDHSEPRQVTISTAPVSQTVSPSALTPEARKISHSRSSTETALIIPRSKTFESPTQTSDDSDDEDDRGPLSKPSLVRKKSGEFVKPALRPSSRRRYSSMPGTPTYSKSVHFNEDTNQTRHFLMVDKPMAVSAGTSPAEAYESENEFPFDSQSESKTERDIKLSNFPLDTFERRAKPIRLERIYLSADKQTLIGSCAAQNIAFNKVVIARFTVDYWKTTSEVVAEYSTEAQESANDGCDRFVFYIKLSDQANIDSKTLLLCVRYNVNGHDYWDNNDDMNYQVDFIKSAQTPAKPSFAPVSSLGARPLSAIPRSRHSPPTSSHGRGRPESIDDDFASRLDTTSAYHFGSAKDQLLGDAPPSIKLKPRAQRGSIYTINTSAAPANGLGGRYDFGASLSAALTSAQDKLGRQSGLMNPAARVSNGSYFGPQERTDGPVKTAERPDPMSSDRPAMGSDQYRDLVQKFCYVGSANKAPTSTRV